MPPQIGEIGADHARLIDALKDWRQGDYFLTPSQFVEMEDVDGSDFAPVASDVAGLVVVTQTCDIVNFGAGKESVVVCPLRDVSGKSLADVSAGRTPSAGLLEHPPVGSLVVDLNRMMSIRKEVLAKLERHVGITSDPWRVRFAEALERKHGRFAFPDKFNKHVLSPLKKKIERCHGKSESENGKAYRSIRTTRVRGTPSWESCAVVVGFHFVLEDEQRRTTTRDKVAQVLAAHLLEIKWPEGFTPESPPFVLQTMDEMTAREWANSYPIDWEFISNRSR